MDDNADISVKQINGLSVRLMTTEQLNSMGITAMGHILLLKSMCDGTDAHLKRKGSSDDCVSPSAQKEKRRQLLAALKDITGNAVKKRDRRQSDVPEPRPSAKPGRPRSRTRKSTVGIRVLDSKKKKGYRQLPSACGDGQVVTLDLELDASYDELLRFIVEKMFPDGLNEVLGNVSDYRVSVVNCVNTPLNSNMLGDFTLRNYVATKMLGGSGTVRIHLFLSKIDDCAEENGPGDGLNNDQHVEVSKTVTYVNLTPSGEVQCRVPVTNANQDPYMMRIVGDLLGSPQKTIGPVTPIDGLGQPCVLNMSATMLDQVTNQSPPATFDIPATLFGQLANRSPPGLLDNSATLYGPLDIQRQSGLPGTDITSFDPLDSPTQPSEPDTPIDLLNQLDTVSDDIHPSVDISVRNHKPPETLKDVLIVLREQTQPDEKKNIINICRNDVLSGTFRGLLRDTWDPRRSLSVRFAGEPGMDGGGLSREFYRLAITAIAESDMFFGDDGDKYLNYSANALDEKWYLAAGRLMAHSLVHGGQMPTFFAKPLYDFLCGKSVAWTLAAVPAAFRNEVMVVENAGGPEELKMAVEPILDIIQLAGCEKYLSKKEELANKLKRFISEDRLMKAYDQLQEGLNSNGVLSYVKRNPSIMEAAFVHTAAALDAGDLVDLCVVSEWSPEGSNKRRIEAEVYSYWLDYLLDKEEERNLDEVLRFLSGATSVPVLGFDVIPSLTFKHDDNSAAGEFPTASTCALTCALPVHRIYNTFKQRMDAAVSMDYFTME